MKKILLGLAFLISTSSLAGSFGKYGIGVSNTAQYGNAASKTFSLGYNEQWWGPLIHQYELGLFTDSSGHGREASAYGFYSVGIEVNADPLVLRSLWGAGLISSPDALLGGRFQFTQDLLLGIRGKNGNLIGLDYKHISSAGIYKPNKGRDYLTIQVEIPW
jgi:Lipid A 3-O-deacylase (PagL)